VGSREQELKLDLAPGVPLPDLRAVPGVAAVASLDDQALDAEYWDTDDLALLRVGATLRRRTGGSSMPRWTLKVPAGASIGGRVLDRIEHDVDDDATEPPARLRDEAAGVTDAPLAPVARLRTARCRVVLVDADGATLAEVDDDEVVVEVPGRPAVTFREVEVELGPSGSRAVLHAVDDLLHAAGATAADPTPKLARGLAHRLGGGSP
jgi:inorganic triphosphatase YgiF